MDRRDFVKRSVLDGLALAAIAPSAILSFDKQFQPHSKRKDSDFSSIDRLSAWKEDLSINEHLHPDFISYLPDVEYFLIGNGDIQGVLQYCRSFRDVGCSFLGLTIMDPEHFCRKWSSFLYSPGRGFSNTNLWLEIDGKRIGATPDNLETIEWDFVDKVPLIRITWRVAEFEMVESIFVPHKGAHLFRSIETVNRSSKECRLRAGLNLVPNPVLFDDISWDHTKRELVAKGFWALRLGADKVATRSGRYGIVVENVKIDPGAEANIKFIYSFTKDYHPHSEKFFGSIWKESAAYWTAMNSFVCDHQSLNHMWETSKIGLKSHIAKSGKRDSGIWEYGMEWVRDDVMVLIGLVRGGLFQEARRVLNHIFHNMISKDGRTIESSQTFDNSMTELDQNGELLFGAWVYLCWTGDTETIRKHWKKICLVAEFPLSNGFIDDSGMIRSSREYWERGTSYGVEPGYELAYQFWVSIGLEKAAEIARAFGNDKYASKWKRAAKSIRYAYLQNPRFRLIEDGHLIKRRTVDGKWVKEIIPPDRMSMPKDTPLSEETVSLLEPDMSEVLPIMYETVDPSSELSRSTLSWVESLWNERWTGGGYERYNSSSEPEPPGPWPFASLFAAEAHWEAGSFDKAIRVVDWLAQMPGFKSGWWFEYYPAYGHPGIGAVGWTWAEIVNLIVDHILGVRPSMKNILIRPRPGRFINSTTAKLRVRDMELTLQVERTNQKPFGFVNGRRVAFDSGRLYIPYSEGKKVMIHLYTNL